MDKGARGAKSFVTECGDGTTESARFCCKLVRSIIMPNNARVTIQYGPYEACGIVELRTSRLAGMEARLTADGHSVEFQEIKDWNIVQLIVNGENVYKCNIKDLDYGGDGKLDSHCTEAVKAVREAY